MNLSREDADLFFKLMWRVHFYVNGQLGLVPQPESVEAFVQLAQEDKLQVRNALYQHMELLDKFVAENPFSLPDDELQIVQRWKRHVAGDFYIVKFLKKHTIFLAAKASKAYAVLGLYDRIEDLLYTLRPPILVKAVLLPFKGRIVYDSLLETYSIFFGPGIRGDLNETYQTVKQAGDIIESLEPEVEMTRPPKPPKPARDWGPVLDGLVETTEQLKPAENAVQTRAFGVLKASARLAQAAAHTPGDLEELGTLARRTQTTLKQLETALRRAGWDEWG